LREPWCLFLDLDGTVLDIAAKPSDVQTEPQLIHTLRQLDDRLDGALAIVSGRPVSDIDRLLAPLTFAAAGVHGSEFRANANGAVTTLKPQVPEHVLALLRDGLSGLAGVLIETKGSTVAVHYRNAPTVRTVIEAVINGMPLRESGLDVMRGRKVFELIPAGTSKLAAILALRELHPFVGRRPIVIGDDVTDEASIDAANAFGGSGLRVAGDHFPQSQADFKSPAEVRAWLQSLVSDTINPGHHAVRL
jgi:trehalose 6-phosphate phosphatase